MASMEFTLRGVLINAAISVCVAVPFWYCWTYMKLGSKYFYFIPKVYKSMPLEDCVGLIFIFLILIMALNLILETISTSLRTR